MITEDQLMERQRLQKIKIASLSKDENYTSEKKTIQELFPFVFDKEEVYTISEEDSVIFQFNDLITNSV